MSDLMELNLENLNKNFKLGLEKFSLEDLDRDFLDKLGVTGYIAYEYDRVLSEKIGSLELDLENLKEAIFFGEKLEIKLYRDRNKGLVGSLFIDDYLEEDIIDKEVLLYPRYAEKYYAERLVLRKHIKYDGDRQAYIYHTRPLRLIMKEER